jgi:hypothetical protein
MVALRTRFIQSVKALLTVPLIIANPPELVIIVQSKVFSARENSPMTTALWK